ncbi:MAG: ABC transporter permease [Oscillospiraceae bacterium]|nr:ABC transporter permease [Oscillospiraceae bacterium]
MKKLLIYTMAAVTLLTGCGDSQKSLMKRAQELAMHIPDAESLEQSKEWLTEGYYATLEELFGQEDDYFNAVYSDKMLNIEEGRVYSVTTKEDITRGSSVFVELMFPLVITLIAAGTVIFCVVMYLMMGVMIDRAASGISLIKIFGYRPKEIRALYLNGNLLIVAVGALLAVPLAKAVMDAIYPSFICNVACSMKLAFPWHLYVLIFAAVILVYFVINRLLIGKINRISPAEILKNRE